jgi:ABC-type Zn uptake system ZnuABC Zn-binding protein ZnuA
MNQSRAAPSAIAILIPLAMIGTAQTGSPAQQDREEQKKMTVIASFYLLYEFASRVAGDRAECQVLSRQV